MKKSYLSAILSTLVGVGSLSSMDLSQVLDFDAPSTAQKMALGAGVAATASYILWRLYTSQQAHAALVKLEESNQAFDAAHLALRPADGHRVLFFDLGDVLVVTNGSAAMHHVGVKKFLAYAARNPGNLFSLQTKIREDLLYPFLNSVCPRADNEVDARDAHNCLLPQILCDWMRGSKTNATILAEIKNHLDEFQFNNQAEKELVDATTAMMFDPNKVGDVLELAPGAQEMIERYARQGIGLGILSNMDEAVFNKLEEKYPNFFRLFRYKIVSGSVGMIKPEQGIYEKIKEVVTEPAQCAITDDRPENNAMAQSLGFKVVHCPAIRSWLPWKKSPDLGLVQRTLDTWLQTPSAAAQPAHA